MKRRHTGVYEPEAEQSFTNCSIIVPLILTGGKGDGGLGGDIFCFGITGKSLLEFVSPNAIFIASAAAVDLS